MTSKFRLLLEALNLRSGFVFEARVCLSYLNKKRNWTKSQITFPDKTIWMIDATAPDPKRDSGSQRLINLMSLISNLGFHIAFSAVDGSKMICHPLGLRVQEVPFSKVLRDLKADKLKISSVWVSRIHVAKLVRKKMRKLALESPIIFDTVDLHGLRIIRSADAVRFIAPKLLGKKIFRDEIEMAKFASNTVVVSEIEANLLRQVGVTNVAIVSNIHELQTSHKTPWTERKGLVFVGNFMHLPNRTAIEWFIEKVWKNLPDDVRQQGLKVIGGSAGGLKRKYDGNHIEFLGRVDDVETLISSSRVSVAPLTSGAGVKGKIGQSLALGIPVVTTVIGAEGMFLEDGISAAVRDDPLDFAEVLAEVALDETLNEKLSVGGLKVIESYFSPMVAMKALSSLLEEVRAIV